MSDPSFIYLASQSPRRRQLLQQLGVRHELLLPGDDEDAEALEAEVRGELPAAYVERVTLAKLESALIRRVARALPAAPVLCSDTTVALGRRIFGKPADVADARRTLRALSGRTHRVITAVAIAWDAGQALSVNTTLVRFRPLTADDIDRYIASGEPFGKAGAYAVQSAAAAWDTAYRRQLLKYHGIAPLRDGAIAETSATRVLKNAGPSPALHSPPMQDILINWAPQETRVAVIENGSVQELHVERTLERGLVGNIYAGRVARVLPGMQSAFIDIGLERAAFLHVADLHIEGAPTRGEPKPNAPPTLPIERLVFEGQTLTVQVIKDPIGTKGARLSAQISIAGRLLVFLPQDDHIGISQKIGSAELREQLRSRMTVLSAQGVERGQAGGFILRTNAEEATDAELADDIAYLRKTWTAIRERSFKVPSATLLHQDLSLVQRVLRDMASDATQTIRIDSLMQYESLARFGAEFTPTSVAKLVHYKGERPMFDLFNVDDEIARALARRVDLKSGGYLIIDQTEALTTVDVNTGGYVGARNFDDTIFKTNLEAAQAIARQLRLRNLGGIIIADFIDMAREDHQATVLGEFRKQLTRDRTKTTVSGFTQLGLVEMTRKRTRESLAHMLCEPCPVCEGKGQVKTARTVCYDILREILREARQFNPKEFRIIASASVVEMLLDEESQHLAGLSDFIGKPISLQAEATGSPETYDIVLM